MRKLISSSVYLKVDKKYDKLLKNEIRIMNFKSFVCSTMTTSHLTFVTVAVFELESLNHEKYLLSAPWRYSFLAYEDE